MIRLRRMRYLHSQRTKGFDSGAERLKIRKAERRELLGDDKILSGVRKATMRCWDTDAFSGAEEAIKRLCRGWEHPWVHGVEWTWKSAKGTWRVMT